jgi:hypothetical protein
MSRPPTEFVAPPQRRSHGLSEAAYLATRLSSAASLAFGAALVGDQESLRLALRRAQVSIERLDRLTRKESA